MTCINKNVNIVVLITNKITNKMKIKDVNKDLIGKKVKCVVTGLEVNGVIVDTFEDKHSVGVVIDHEPVQWGESTFTRLNSTSRKFDGFGNLELTELI